MGRSVLDGHHLHGGRGPPRRGVGPVTDGSRTLADSVPRLLGPLVILLVDHLVARVASTLADKALERAGFDRAVEEGGTMEALASSQYDASDVVAELVFFAVLVPFLSAAVGALGIAALQAPLAESIALIPGIIVVIVLVVVGAVLAGAVRRPSGTRSAACRTATLARRRPAPSSSSASSGRRSTRSASPPPSPPRCCTPCWARSRGSSSVPAVAPRSRAAPLEGHPVQSGDRDRTGEGPGEGARRAAAAGPADDARAVRGLPAAVRAAAGPGPPVAPALQQPPVQQYGQPYRPQ